jgi:choline-sulfatase
MPKLSRREFTKLFTANAAVLAASTSINRIPTAFGNTSRPNIVFVCSDNQSFRDTGFGGHPQIKTPNLDLIAKRGVVFSNAYCGSPVCAPGRTSMMTGMFSSDSNSFCNATPWDGSHAVWAKHLSNAGYYARSIGKLDLNGNFDTGFEEFESKHGHVEKPDITALFRRPLGYRIGERPNVNGAPRDTVHEDSNWTAMATEFIREESKSPGKPWALYVGLHQPHVAFFERMGFLALKKYWDMYPLESIKLPDVPLEHLDSQHLAFQELRRFKRLATPLSENKMRRALAGYYGMITELDEYVGQIWDALKQTKQLDNTVFVFTSDNGMSMGEHGLFFHNSLYEEAIHVPMLIAGAGIPKGLTIDKPVSHVDMISTMLDLADAKPASRLRGHSLVPLMNGNKKASPEFVYSENHSEGNCTGSFMIRKGQWKYIHFTWYDDLLFDLSSDPGEMNNLADNPKAQDIKKELKEILDSQVDTEALTLKAFKRQEKILDGLADRMSEDELYQLFEFRLGPGQARAMAAKCKGR